MVDDQVTPAQLPQPGTVEWRVMVATLAHRFFGLIHSKDVAEQIGYPADAGKAGAWPLCYFTLYIQKVGVPSDATEIAKILIAMESAGLLLRSGWRADMNGLPMQGQLYIAQGLNTKQITGNLWLSEVVGADLVIQSYNAVTVQICAEEGSDSGTGLILDRTHVLTNRHVIEDLSVTASNPASRSIRRSNRRVLKRSPGSLA